MRWLQLRGPAVDTMMLIMPMHCNAWSDYRGGGVALLAQLPNLRHLNMMLHSDFMVPAYHFSVLRFLPQLESLNMMMPSGGSWNREILAPVQFLTALTSLRLTITQLSLQMDISTMLGKLTQLRILSLNRQHDCHAHSTNQDQLMQAVSKLTGLQELTFGGLVDTAPAELGNLAQLSELYLSDFLECRIPFAIPASLVFCTRLTHVSLSQLSYRAASGWWGICRSLLALSSLESLAITKTNLSTVRPEAWALSSSLTKLDLSWCSIPSIPPAACLLPRLQELNIVGTELSHLPSGAYLYGLRALSITCPGSHSGAGPESLKDASFLEELTVHGVMSNTLWAAESLQTIVPRTCWVDVRSQSVEATIRVYSDDESEY